MRAGGDPLYPESRPPWPLGIPINSIPHSPILDPLPTPPMFILLLHSEADCSSLHAPSVHTLAQPSCVRSGAALRRPALQCTFSLTGVEARGLVSFACSPQWSKGHEVEKLTPDCSLALLGGGDVEFGLNTYYAWARVGLNFASPAEGWSPLCCSRDEMSARLASMATRAVASSCWRRHRSSERELVSGFSVRLVRSGRASFIRADDDF